MKKLNAFLVSVLATAALNAAVIEQVIVRQQWPWSTDIKVEYKLSAVTNPVDIAVQAFNGETELSLPAEAITGDRYAITEDGVGALVIDPVKAFGTVKVALANFKIKLSVVDSPEKMVEVLYKIFDLSNGSCRDVTRADFLNGKMGAFETSFSAIGEGFRTDLPDVLIWTGVTNDTKYATDFLVMRRISAKNIEWQMGSPADEVDHYADEPIHTVKLTNDFFIGVFPITVGQANHSSVMPTKKRWEYGDYSQHGDKNLMPATMDLYYARGDTAYEDVYFWPRDGHAVTDNSFLGKLRQLTNNQYEFDLPTEAQWEFACRAGTTTVMYDGKSYSSREYFAAGLCLGWSQYNSENGYWPVGLLKPNAFGLYDMVGNLLEFCLDTKADDYGGTTGVSIDPKGPEVNVFDSSKTVRRGGFYAWDPTLYRSAGRYGRAGGGTEGVRVVIPADR